MRNMDHRLSRLEHQQRLQAPLTPLVVWLAEDEDPATALKRLGLPLDEIEGRPLLYVKYASRPLLITEKES